MVFGHGVRSTQLQLGRSRFHNPRLRVLVLGALPGLPKSATWYVGLIDYDLTFGRS